MENQMKSKCILYKKGKERKREMIKVLGRVIDQGKRKKKKQFLINLKRR